MTELWTLLIVLALVMWFIGVLWARQEARDEYDVDLVELVAYLPLIGVPYMLIRALKRRRRHRRDAPSPMGPGPVP